MLNLKRLWAIFKSRNHEFFRDREAFGWNFLFPFLIIVGFSVIFGGDHQTEFKVGFFPLSSPFYHQQCNIQPSFSARILQESAQK